MADTGDTIDADTMQQLTGGPEAAVLPGSAEYVVPGAAPTASAASTVAAASAESPAAAVAPRDDAAGEQSKWESSMADAGMAMDRLPSCEESSGELMLNQRSVIEYSAQQLDAWRASWSAGGTARPPPPLPGLLVYHNVGSGKTAIILGAAHRALSQWDDITVLVVASRGQMEVLAQELPMEYHRFGIALPPHRLRMRRLSLRSGRGDWVVSGMRPPAGVFASLSSHDRFAVLRIEDVAAAAAGGTFPDGPVLLIVDGAHRLVEDGHGTDYARLARFLRRGGGNTYRMLLTATPGTTPRRVAKICALVAPREPETQNAIMAVGTDAPPSKEALRSFTDAMAGCVDAWQMLGATALYPLLHFAGGGGGGPLAGADAASRHVAATCSGRSTAAEVNAALAEDARFAEYAGAENSVGATLRSAIEGAKRGRPGASVALGTARLYAQFPSDAARPNLVHSVRAACDASRDAIRSAAAAGSTEPPPCALTTLSPRLALLALRLLRPVADPTAAERIASRGQMAMPPCKQVVVVPLPAAQLEVYPQQHFVRAVLERVCGLLPYKRGRRRAGGEQFYIDGSVPGASELAGRAGPFNAGNAAAVGALRDRTEQSGAPRLRSAPYIVARRGGAQERHDTIKAAAAATGVSRADVRSALQGDAEPGGWSFEQRQDGGPAGGADRYAYAAQQVFGRYVPVVLLPNAEVADMFNMYAVQRLHLTDWADPAVLAHAMGRAQRLYAACALPPTRRAITVFTYSTACAAADDASAEIGKVVVQQLDRAVADEGGSLWDTLAKTAQALRRGGSTSVAPPAALEAVRAAQSAPRTGSFSAADLRALGAMSHGGYADVVADTYDQVERIIHGAAAGGRITVDRSSPAADIERAIVDAVREAAPDLDMGAAWKRAVAALVAEKNKQRSEQSQLAATADALGRLARWRSAADEQPEGLDETLARGFASSYTAVLRLYAALMEASVSCALYGPLHLLWGQLPGMQADSCTAPQRLPCNGENADCPADQPLVGDEAARAAAVVAKPHSTSAEVVRAVRSALEAGMQGACSDGAEGCYDAAAMAQAMVA